MDGHVRARCTLCVVVLFVCLSYCVYALPRVVSWVTRVRCTYYEKMLAVIAAISSPTVVFLRYLSGLEICFRRSLKSIRRLWSALYWPRRERKHLDPSFEISCEIGCTLIAELSLLQKAISAEEHSRFRTRFRRSRARSIDFVERSWEKRE
jgi:hypothetical protein